MKRSPLRRKTPLRAKKSLERSSDLDRSTPIKPVNPERRKKRFREGFGSEDRAAFVQRLPCWVCGRTPSENAHAVSRGAGGTTLDVLPLCHLHHAEQHQVGVETFSERYDVDLDEAARETERRWRERND